MFRVTTVYKILCITLCMRNTGSEIIVLAFKELTVQLRR